MAGKNKKNKAKANQPQKENQPDPTLEESKEGAGMELDESNTAMET